MAVWPATLPQAPLTDGFSEIPQDGTLRTETDIGPSKTRQRFTALASYYTVRYAMTAAQKATCITFYKTDTKGGSLAFTWPHPETGNVQARFLSPPKFTPRETDVVADIALEVLP